MPVKDLIHDIVKTALIRDGWTITHDPLSIRLGDMRAFADLGAERPIAAEKEGRKIAVEIKSFAGLSVMEDLEKAIGQFGVYSAMLAEVEPDRLLYLAVSEEVFASAFATFAGQVLVKRLALRIVAVDLVRKEIAQWIS
ncbi:MAG: XisH family protein [Chloroflexi bacterium]|nr:XisH family protein [Chloroflexota bacterium]